MEKQYVRYPKQMQIATPPGILHHTQQSTIPIRTHSTSPVKQQIINPQNRLPLIQQQTIKQRKKQQQQQQQQHMTNPSGSWPATMRKLPNNNSTVGSAPSILVKSDNLDMSQLTADPNPNTIMAINDGTQQTPR